MENKTTIKNTAVVSENAVIGKNCIIDDFAIIYPNVVIEDNTYIGPYSIIGSPTMNFYIDQENHRFEKTIIGKNSIIRSHTVIYENNIIGNNFQTGHHVTIREKSKIGNNCSVGTLSDIQGRVEIGNFVRMHSNVHIGMFTKIEDYVWLFPYVLITNDMYPPHDKLEGCTICYCRSKHNYSTWKYNRKKFLCSCRFLSNKKCFRRRFRNGETCNI